MPRHKPRELPPEDMLAEYFWALIDNAEALCADAELLLSRGSSSRALMFAITASEELVKAADITYWDYVVGNKLGSWTLEELTKGWNDHQAKLESVYLYYDLSLTHGSEPSEQAAEDLSEEEMTSLMVEWRTSMSERAAQDRHNRMTGLYVDIEDGKIRRPDSTPAKDARKAILRAREVVTNLRKEASSRTAYCNSIFFVKAGL